MYYIMHSGVRVDPANIENTTIYLEDIAHHLSNIQRFGGALPFDVNYSVAHHSILMAEYVRQYLDDPELAAHCLMHDASEAYLGDVVTGLKAVLPEYKLIEFNLTQKIEAKYRLVADKTRVHSMDKRILLDEVRNLMPNRYALFKKLAPELEELGIFIPKNEPKQAIKERFLELCGALEIEDCEDYSVL